MAGRLLRLCVRARACVRLYIVSGVVEGGCVHERLSALCVRVRLRACNLRACNRFVRVCMCGVSVCIPMALDAHRHIVHASHEHLLAPNRTPVPR